MEQDARARWVAAAAVAAAGAQVEEQTPSQARAQVELWLDDDGSEAGPPPGMDAEQWELRRELGVA